MNNFILIIFSFLKFKSPLKHIQLKLLKAQYPHIQPQTIKFHFTLIYLICITMFLSRQTHFVYLQTANQRHALLPNLTDIIACMLTLKSTATYVSTIVTCLLFFCVTAQ